MYNILRSAIACFLIVSIASAQTTSDSKVKADNIKKKYPDQEVYVENSSQEITYSVTSSTKSGEPQLSIKNNRITDYLSLMNSVEYTEIESYDSFTEIESIVFSTKTGKNFVTNYTPVYDKAYESDGIFHSDVRLKIASFILRTKGDQLRSEIKESYKDHTFFDALYFHKQQPTEKSTITIKVPDGVSIGIHKINFDKGKVLESTVTDPKTKMTTYTFTMENLPPGITVGYGSTGYSMNFPHLILVVKKYAFKGVSKKGFETFDDFYAFLHQLNSEVDNDDTPLKPKVEEIIKGKTSDEDKIKSIYYWVQDNIRYIAFEYGIAGYKPMSAQEVLEKKYGDCKGVANLVSRMLQLAGYDAKFVWIHTNFSPYDCTIPYLGNFNHAIAYLEFKGKEYFLDCTESYAAFGENAFRIQGRKVLVEMGDTYKITQIPLEKASTSRYEEVSQLILKENNLNGTTKFAAYGDMKNYYLRRYHYAKSEDQKDFFRKMYNKSNANLDVLSASNSDLENREIPLSVNVTYTLSNQVITDGNELYINLEYDPYFHKVLKDTVAYLDMTFDETVDYRMTTKFTVPNGYKVKEMPETYAVQTSYCTIKIEYKLVNNTIEYTKIYEFPTGIIPKENIKEWIAIQKQLKRAYTNQIILTK